MNHWNLTTDLLDSEQLATGEHWERSVWMHLIRFCVGQTNGGEIVACKSWTDRKWQLACRITKAEAETHSLLWNWNGESLRVWGYPHDSEANYKLAISAGKLGAKRRWNPHKKKPNQPSENGSSE